MKQGLLKEGKTKWADKSLTLRSWTIFSTPFEGYKTLYPQKDDRDILSNSPHTRKNTLEGHGINSDVSDRRSN